MAAAANPIAEAARAGRARGAATASEPQAAPNSAIATSTAVAAGIPGTASRLTVRATAS